MYTTYFRIFNIRSDKSLKKQSENAIIKHLQLTVI